MRKLCVTVALMAMSVMPLMNAGAAPSSPLIHPSHIATTPNLIPLGVSCTPSDFCMLLSRQQSAYGAPEFSTTWNGHNVSAPQRIPGAEFLGMDDSGGLSEVSCPSSNFCMSVGQGPALKTSYLWANGVWKSVPIPAPQPIVPAVPAAEVATQAIGWTSISCVSSSFCFAVGRYLVNQIVGDTQTEKVATTFIRWNGAAWIPFAVWQDADIEHVSCASILACEAVGTSSATWNGSHWGGQGVPGETLNSQTTPNFTSISCIEGTEGAACLAVGSTSVIKWSPKAPSGWHVVAHPSSVSLEQVDCHSPTLCVAIGYSTESSNPEVLSQWNGALWTSATVPGQGFSGGGVGVASSTSDVLVDTNLGDTETYWSRG